MSNPNGLRVETARDDVRGGDPFEEARRELAKRDAEQGQLAEEAEARRIAAHLETKTGVLAADERRAEADAEYAQIVADWEASGGQNPVEIDPKTVTPATKARAAALLARLAAHEEKFSDPIDLS